MPGKSTFVSDICNIAQHAKPRRGMQIFGTCVYFPVSVQSHGIFLQSFAGGKKAFTTSRRCYWHDVIIGCGLMKMRFEQQKHFKWDTLLKIKAVEENIQSLYNRRDKGTSSLCPWFATSTTRQAKYCHNSYSNIIIKFNGMTQGEKSKKKNVIYLKFEIFLVKSKEFSNTKVPRVHDKYSCIVFIKTDYIHTAVKKLSNRKKNCFVPKYWKFKLCYLHSASFE